MPIARTTLLCIALTLPATVSARSPDCGAVPVHGRDGSVLYHTGTPCRSGEHRPEAGDGSGGHDEAPVSRNGGLATSPAQSIDPVPESRPVQDAVTVAG